MRDSIDSYFFELDCIDDQLPVQTILRWLVESPFTVDDLANFLVFRRDHYVRNLVHVGPQYQCVVLCWRSGQRSPIHNHRGSHCGVKVLAGAATETVFTRAANGMIVPDRSRHLLPDHISASSDDDIHQVSNLQSGGADLITLHIYSPPLLRMDVFSLETADIKNWDVPINDTFVLGGGI
jgi:cysteine dioxygenase